MDQVIGSQVIWRESGEGSGFSGPGKVVGICENGLYIELHHGGVLLFEKKMYHFWMIIPIILN